MSKKINFSLTDSEYEKLETEAQKRGLKVIDIVRERYEMGSSNTEKILQFISKNSKKTQSDKMLILTIVNIFLNQTAYIYECMKHSIRSSDNAEKLSFSLKDQVKIHVKDCMKAISDKIITD